MLRTRYFLVIERSPRAPPTQMQRKKRVVKKASTLKKTSIVLTICAVYLITKLPKRDIIRPLSGKFKDVCVRMSMNITVFEDRA